MTRRSRLPPLSLVLSCEHGGNRVPATYRALFASPRARRALASHRGYDAGALALAQHLSRRLCAPLVATTVTRLLVEPNRSPHHHALLSEFSRGLDAPARRALVARHHTPHRQAVEEAVRAAMGGGARVLHVGVHSFTPELGGERRTAELSLLYDPRRPHELELCRAWQRMLRAQVEPWRVRRNYPYRGRDDGLTTHLRRVLPADRYLGIELEVNQGLLAAGARGEPAFPAPVRSAVLASLAALLGGRPERRGPQAARRSSVV
ncbi:MAG: N-formylglutamate amidohydrolase [Myxococcales bacterium]|nr:N-formylglutamate amidohydrolase [Myxococcales bacterium]